MTEEKQDENAEASQSEEVDEEERNIELAQSAFRRPRTGISERLVCQSLFQGTFSDIPEKMISHLCVAALNCESLMQKDTENKEKLDVDQIEGIYAVNQSFQQAVSTKIDQSGRLSICIPWAFKQNEESYQKYVLPWASSINLHYWTDRIDRSILCKGYKIKHQGRIYVDCGKVLAVCYSEEHSATRDKIVKEWKNRECPKCNCTIREPEINSEETTLIRDKPEWKWFFGVTKALSLDSERELKSRFNAWAIPILERVKMVIGSYISPQTYEDVVKLLAKAKPENEEPQLAQ